MNRTAILAALAASYLSAGSVSSAETVAFDFEAGDLQGWEVVEGKFDYFVSDRPEFHNRYPDYPDRKYNKQGKYYLSTVEQQPGRPSNDRMTGVAESPVFVLLGPKMSMLVGAGVPARAYVALCTFDGGEVLKGRGKRHTEAMQRVEWDAPQLVGRKVFLRIVDRETGGWGYVAFDDFKARGRIDAAATRERFARRRFELAMDGINLAALRAAIADLTETFGHRYPRGGEFLGALDRLERRAVDAAPDMMAKLGEEIRALRREALVSNPLVSDHPILFVTRRQYRSHYHAIDTLFHTGEHNWDRKRPHADAFGPGGSMKTVDVRTRKVTTLVDVPEGIARDPDVHYDGGRIVFAMRRTRDEDYHIYEVNTDGTGLRQLTSMAGASDFDPVYLPDGGIVFSSTREPKYNMCSRDHAANLYRMDADGSNVFRITRNTLFDNHPEVMPDGRILYARWEYVDRNFGDAHGLWVVNPDGTGQAIYWGNNTAVPAAAFNSHVIPGSHRVLTILGQHHDRLWGALSIIDRRLGVDGKPSVVRTWPAEARDIVRTGGAFDCDAFRRFNPKYEDPWPLSEKYFLVSRMVGRGEEMGVYLVDTFGNELLLHAEAPGCYDPMPVMPRRRPRVIPTRRRFDGGSGYVLLQDVYVGTHMKGVARGAVKYVRVVESPTKKNWSGGSWGGQGYQAPGMNWHDFTAKRIIGDAPVEADGSAYFEVPSDTFIFFQALDANRMMVQSMRSGTVVQPGETQSCVGCHEDRDRPPRHTAATSLAANRAPSRLGGWLGRSEHFSFMRDVQPVFDRHCVKCHDFGKDAGKKLVLAPDRNPYFNAAYVDLWIWNRKMITCVGAGPAEIQPAYSWGSHPSRLSQVLRKGHEKHKDLKLSAEDMARINTWLDLNAPYYPFYESAYPDSPSGRSPLDGRQLRRLEALTGVDFDGRLKNHGRRERPQISFDRPELSPCLGKLRGSDEARYREALAIITAGRQALKRTPRCDMAGFEPCAVDRERLSRFDRRDRIEREFRSAIRDGRTLRDRDVAAPEPKE
ncbi:MAG: HzsA-related protein [Planctomycetota bacterium]|jgi:hypothetical protein